MSCGTCEKTPKLSRRKRKVQTKDLESEEVIAATVKFGEEQTADGAEYEGTLAVMAESIAYMASDQVISLPGEFRDNCLNKYDLCSFWAYIGK